MKIITGANIQCQPLPSEKRKAKPAKHAAAQRIIPVQPHAILKEALIPLTLPA
jgi:hypothetical protein